MLSKYKRKKLDRLIEEYAEARSDLTGMICEGGLREQEECAVDVNTKDDSHEKREEAELQDGQHDVGHHFSKDQLAAADGRHVELLQRSQFFFAHDRIGREHGRHHLAHDHHQSGKKEVWRTGIWIEENFRANFDGKSLPYC